MNKASTLSPAVGHGDTVPVFRGRSLVPMPGAPAAGATAITTTGTGIITDNGTRAAPGISWAFALAYIVFEYLRPQAMYPAIAILPLAQLNLVFLALTLAVEGRFFGRRHYLEGLLAAFFVWCAISSAAAFVPDLSFSILADVSTMFVACFLVGCALDTPKRLCAFIVVYLLSLLKITQFATRLWVSNGFHFDSRGLHEGGGIGIGFLQNPDDLGVALNVVFGLALYLLFADKKFWFKVVYPRVVYLGVVLTLPIAVLTTGSRGAALGLASVCVFMLLRSKHKTIGAVALAAAVVGFVVVMPEDALQRFKATGSETDTSGSDRMELWSAGLRMAAERPLTGVGPGNYVFVNTRMYGYRSPVVQHNVFIQAVSETGIPGLLLFTAMVVGIFLSNRQARRNLPPNHEWTPWLKTVSYGLDAGAVGFATTAFFITVLYFPFFWVQLALSIALSQIAKNLRDVARARAQAV